MTGRRSQVHMSLLPSYHSRPFASHDSFNAIRRAKLLSPGQFIWISLSPADSVTFVLPEGASAPEDAGRIKCHWHLAILDYIESNGKMSCWIVAPLSASDGQSDANELLALIWAPASDRGLGSPTSRPPELHPSEIWNFGPCCIKIASYIHSLSPIDVRGPVHKNSPLCLLPGELERFHAHVVNLPPRELECKSEVSNDETQRFMPSGMVAETSTSYVPEKRDNFRPSLMRIYVSTIQPPECVGPRRVQEFEEELKALKE
jgi:hypothetical protein